MIFFEKCMCTYIISFYTFRITILILHRRKVEGQKAHSYQDHTFPLVKELWSLSLLTSRTFPAPSLQVLVIGVVFNTPAEQTAQVHPHCCPFPFAGMGSRKVNSWNCFSSQNTWIRNKLPSHSLLPEGK